MPAHPRCFDWQTGGYTHICQEPSGEECIEDGCSEPAGTLWTRLWCPGHDVERQDRISEQLRRMQRWLKPQNPQTNT